MSHLVGNILERKPSEQRAPAPRMTPGARGGFPAATHRSQSAFARSRSSKEAQSKLANGTSAPPIVHAVSGSGSSRPSPLRTTITSLDNIPSPIDSRAYPDDHSSEMSAVKSPSSWEEQMRRENEQRIAGMTDNEREAGVQEVVDMFGPGIGDLMRAVREARERRAASSTAEAPPPTSSPLAEHSPKEQEGESTGSEPVSSTSVENTHSNDLRTRLEEVPLTSEEAVPTRPSSPAAPVLSRSNTRPSSRADRRLRFAAVQPKDVHVYESAPSSPKKRLLALPPPEAGDSDAVSLGQFKATSKSLPTSPITAHPPLPLPSSHTPEVVEAFTTDSASHSKRPLGDPEEGSPEYIRRRYFPTAAADDPNIAWMASQPATDSNNPTLRFDLHGAPIPFKLSSELPTHLGLHHHSEGSHAGYTIDDVFMLSRSTVPAQRATMLGVLAGIVLRLAEAQRSALDGMEELRGREEDIRSRALAAGAEAMGERGSVGARAVEVVWASIVGSDVAATLVDGVELEAPGDTAITSLPMGPFLERVAALFVQRDLGQGPLAQLLAVVLRLAKHNGAWAEAIAQDSALLSNLMSLFVLTPYPPREGTSLPSPVALDLLNTLVTASRTAAQAIAGPADALLRFVASTPGESVYGRALADELLRGTLRVYAALAAYGLHAHLATTATEPLSRIARYVMLADTPRPLLCAWAALQEAWITCAVDPHRTTPPHELLWSQVVGWGWKEDLDEVSGTLTDSLADRPAWTALWMAQAAWLEGARVNGVRGGLEERSQAADRLRPEFEEGGRAHAVVSAAVEAVGSGLAGDVPDIRQLGESIKVLTAVVRLLLSCLPSAPEEIGDGPPFPLPFAFLSEISARLVGHALWDRLDASVPRSYALHRPLSQYLACYLQLSRRLPGVPQELWLAQALTIVTRLLPGDELGALGIVDEIVSLVTQEWDTARGRIIPPVVWERGGFAVIQPFLRSALKPQADAYIAPLNPTPASIQQATTLRLPSTTGVRQYGLPASRDWVLAPLGQLLRSGTSPVFKTLPSDWDATETEVVRTTLALTCLARDVLRRFLPARFSLSREEAAFGCMQVCMLEHDQPQTQLNEEVFRDATVGQLMDALLAPYTVQVGWQEQDDIERVAARFLGGSTPFFQFYQDLVGLYDAVSFAHPTFARLLLVPTTLRYAEEYRKFLWDDYSHLLRGMRCAPGDIVAGSVGEYLWPVERSAVMLGAYLKCLVKSAPRGFMRWIAVHHVACNIWGDLRGEEGQEERASKLLQSVAGQASKDVLRDVVLYVPPEEGKVWESSEGTAWTASPVTDLDEEAKAGRRQSVIRWVPVGMKEALAQLLS
ncbi:hypothetical protein BD626DRAFT_433540 [Schizophyllum amplum]|uniref:Uncharacterized protein n=1 Tax=Schizophyllum amplum TaxID=97359 RepID=A0A550CBH4_9AGAR|nr:hypothetical protein BD626DRAFT_433540 [Auriculariopsis ampla]